MAETQPWWLQDLCYTAEEFRQHTASFVAVEGIADVAGGDLKVTSTAAGNNSVNVAAGQAFIQGDTAGSPDDTKGVYRVLNDNTGRVEQLTANPSADARIDTVVATVRDNEYGGGFDDWFVQVIAGTPTAGAQVLDPIAAGYRAGAGVVPDNSVVLAYVRAIAGSTLATTIAAADIEDARRQFVSGGEQKVASTRWLKSTTQSIPNTSETLVTFPAGFDGTSEPNAWYSESGGTVKFHQPGVYDILVEVEWTANSDATMRRVRIYREGGLEIAESSGPSINSASITTTQRFSAVTDPDVGDEISLWASQGAAGAVTIAKASMRIVRRGAALAA